MFYLLMSKMTDKGDGWKFWGTLSLIFSALSLIVSVSNRDELASTRGEVRKNTKSISSLKHDLSDFQRTYYEDKNQRDADYRFLWNEIEKRALTPDEKNRLLSYLDKAYREKLDVSNRF